jgi:hypothetical protein
MRGRQVLSSSAWQRSKTNVKQSTSKGDKLETRELEADHRRDRTGRQAAGGEQDAEDADTED